MTHSDKAPTAGQAKRKQAARNSAAEYLRRIGHITGAEADAILRGKWDCRAEVTWFMDNLEILKGTRP